MVSKWCENTGKKFFHSSMFCRKMIDNRICEKKVGIRVFLGKHLYVQIYKHGTWNTWGLKTPKKKKAAPASSILDLLITQMEVTCFTPEKVTNKIPTFGSQPEEPSAPNFYFSLVSLMRKACHGWTRLSLLATLSLPPEPWRGFSGEPTRIIWEMVEDWPL